MNTIARELNEILKNTMAGSLLSDLGRRMYFPKGIVAQSAEAKEKATKFNATVGMAKKNNEPLYLPSIFTKIQGIAAHNIFSYAPTAGDPALRTAWKKEMLKKNPSLAGKEISLPIVTSGMTHGILMAADLFLDKGDTVIVPDMFWGNYHLIFEERREADIVSFPFFSEEGVLNLEALEQAIIATAGDKVALLLNFPNNPTGYSPSEDEVEAIVAILLKYAKSGKHILVLTDDAYFGLFYEEETYTESLFAPLANLHENILAIKLDGATKEDFVWGFRVGFLTYGGKGLTAEQYAALIQKTMGAIRSSVSNCSRPAQTLLLQGMMSSTYEQEKQAAFSILKARYSKVKEILALYADQDTLIPLPFNSGYFMAFLCKGDAEALRIHLLENYGIGAIAIQRKYLRIAFSSIDLPVIAELFKMLFQAADDLWS